MSWSWRPPSVGKRVGHWLVVQDEKKAIEKEVQGVTDDMIKSIDEMVANKQKELAKV